MPFRINVRMLLAAGLIVLLTACCLLFVAVRGAAAGTPVEKKLSFTCPFPLIGLQKLDAVIKADFEVPAAPGGTLTTSGLTITVSVPDKAARGLNLVGATTVEGTAAAEITLVNGDANPLPVRIPLNVGKTEIPATGSFSPVATGSVPTVTLAKPGKTTLTVGDFTTRLTPKKADGSFTGLGSFTSDCTLDPGQDAVLLSFDLGGTPAGRHYTVAGKTGLKALGTTAPLTGGFDLSPTAATVFAGGPVFDRTHADFRLFGFVPGAADLEFVADGPQGGDLTGTGFVARPRFTTVLPLVTLLGMPVSSGPACRTSSPSTAELRTGDGFTMAAGGALTGTYALAPLTGCGAFTPYLSTFVQGDGNTFDLVLTPRKA